MNGQPFEPLEQGARSMTMISLSPVDTPDPSVEYPRNLEVRDIEGLRTPQECRCLLAAFGKCPTQSAYPPGFW
jgi:hypothetical protein